MKTFFTRTLALLAAMTAALGTQAYDFQAGGVYYNITKAAASGTPGTVSVTSGDGYSGNIVIPATVENDGNTYEVTAIAAQAFQNSIHLSAVTIGSNVTTIGQNSFKGCNGLTTITIPDSVTTIGNYAFYICSGLRNTITIPNSVITIGQGAFANCSTISGVTIGSGVTTIGQSAFYYCTNLSTITSLATTAPSINTATFQNVKTGGTLYVPTGSTGYNAWMSTGNNYLGKYSWTKVEQ